MAANQKYWGPRPIHVTTGDVATVDDTFDLTKPGNGAKMELGGIVFGIDQSGRVCAYRYVRYNPTAAVTEAVGIVFPKDNTRTVMTATRSEAIYGDVAGAQVGGGILLNAAITPGNFGFIQVGGFLAAYPVPASTAAGDGIVSATGAQAQARVAAGTAYTAWPIAVAITAVAGGVSDVNVTLESAGA
jgi:hypothetical protein